MSTLGSYKRLGLQAGLLAGLGIAVASASDPEVMAGPQDCVVEGESTFVKPNLMIVVDYSTSMDQEFQGRQTRWEAAVDAVTLMVDADNGFLHKNMSFALMRFGHDPNGVDTPGGVVAGDVSVPALSDGQALDVPWYQEGNDLA